MCTYVYVLGSGDLSKQPPLAVNSDDIASCCMVVLYCRSQVCCKQVCYNLLTVSWLGQNGTNDSAVQDHLDISDICRTNNTLLLLVR